jgi:archaellum component FlaF (FlaF/FlaG flagellin family)
VVVILFALLALACAALMLSWAVCFGVLYQYVVSFSAVAEAARVAAEQMRSRAAALKNVASNIDDSAQAEHNAP